MMVSVAFVAALIGILGGVASFVVLSFKVGQWKKELEQDHEDMREGHQMVHEDIERLVDDIGDVDISSNRRACDICDESGDD